MKSKRAQLTLQPAQCGLTDKLRRRTKEPLTSPLLPFHTNGFHIDFSNLSADSTKLHKWHAVSVVILLLLAACVCAVLLSSGEKSLARPVRSPSTPPDNESALPVPAARQELELEQVNTQDDAVPVPASVQRVENSAQFDRIKRRIWHRVNKAGNLNDQDQQQEHDAESSGMDAKKEQENVDEGIFRETSPEEYSKKTSNNLLEKWAPQTWAGVKRDVSDRIRALRRVLIVMKEFFDESGVRYFLDRGTLLGSWRDGQLVPWDGAAEVGVLDEGFSSIARALDAYTFPQDIGVVVRTGDDAMRVPFMFVSKSTGFYLSVYQYHTQDNALRQPWPTDIGEVEAPDGGWQCPMCFDGVVQFSADLIQPLRRCSLEGVAHWCPASVERYLKHFYLSLSVPPKYRTFS